MEENLVEEVEETLPRAPKKRKYGWLIALAVGLLIGALLNFFVVKTYVIPSGSMENTLEVGDYIVSVPLLDNQSAPKRGTVILFHPPKSWNKPADYVLIKRVIAVGGDTVACCSVNGKVIVNNKEIDEPYLKDGNSDPATTFFYRVPAGKVFVMGDNRADSADSRYHPSEPFIPVSDIIGQPDYVYWPLNRVKKIN